VGCNPPYSSIEPWVKKAWDEIRREALVVCMLLPANRTEQPWWQQHIEPFRDKKLGLTTEFLAGRVGFIGGASRAVHAPFGSVVLIWEH